MTLSVARSIYFKHLCGFNIQSRSSEKPSHPLMECSEDEGRGVAR